MTAPIAVETRTGAQLLPRRLGQLLTLSPWQAHLVCDADQRTKHDTYWELAERVSITYPNAALAAGRTTP